LFSNDGGGGGSDDVYVPYVPSGSIPEDDIISGWDDDDGRDEPTTELVDDGGDDDTPVVPPVIPPPDPEPAVVPPSPPEPVGPAEPHTPAERPDEPDHNVVVPNDEPLTEEQMEINFIMGILFREQNNANLSQDQLQVLADANAAAFLTVKQREQYIRYISYLDDLEMPRTNVDEALTAEQNQANSMTEQLSRDGDRSWSYKDPQTGQIVQSGQYYLNQHGLILLDETGEPWQTHATNYIQYVTNDPNYQITLPAHYYEAQGPNQANPDYVDTRPTSANSNTVNETTAGSSQFITSFWSDVVHVFD
jgi:hypothetical protein